MFSQFLECHIERPQLPGSKRPVAGNHQKSHWRDLPSPFEGRGLGRGLIKAENNMTYSSQTFPHSRSVGNFAASATTCSYVTITSWTASRICSCFFGQEHW